jgi:hypothetical protein
MSTPLGVIWASSLRATEYPLAERERGSADGGQTIYTGKRRGVDSPPFLVTYMVVGLQSNVPSDRSGEG